MQEKTDVINVCAQMILVIPGNKHTDEGGGAVYQTQQILGGVMQMRDRVIHKATSVSESRMRDKTCHPARQ